MQTRAKLLRATSDLLAQKGPAGLSMKEAARLAQVSRAVAYKHFEDRDHLLREARSWIADQLMQSSSDVQSASMEQTVNHVAQLVLNNLEASRVFVNEAMTSSGLNVRHPLYRQTRKAIERFKASGEARSDMDVDMMCVIMLGSIAMLIMLSGVDKRLTREALAERFTTEWSRILRHGIFNAPTPTPTPTPKRKRKKSA